LAKWFLENKEFVAGEFFKSIFGALNVAKISHQKVCLQVYTVVVPWQLQHQIILASEILKFSKDFFFHRFFIFG
jgi:hypothetical protein